MHDAETWKEIREVFESVVDLPEEEAVNFLVQSHLNPAVLSEVQQLLNVARTQDSFLEDSINSEALSALEVLVEQVHPQVPNPESGSYSGSRHLQAERFETSSDGKDAALRKLDLDQQTSKIQTEVEASFPNYKICEVLGRGGQGVVFLARDKRLGRDVALKVLVAKHPSGNSSRETELSTTRQQQLLLLQEARTAAAIEHPNVATVYSVDSLGKTVVLATQYVDGENLKYFLHQNLFIPPLLAANVASQVAEALAAAHQRGVIHRDIKPANILLQLGDEKLTHAQRVDVKVVDFGLAIQPERKPSDWDPNLESANDPSDSLASNTLKISSSRRAGSLPYMSPEQWLDGTCNHQSDIYSLGITMYQMLVGRVPYVGSPPVVIRQILTADPVPLRRINPDVPRDLESIVLKAMSRLPENRYESATEMAADLERFRLGKTTLARPLSGGELLRRWYQRDWKTAYSVTALLVTLLIASVVTTSLSAVVWRKNTQLLETERLAELQTAQTLIDASPETAPLAVTQISESESAVRQVLLDTMNDESFSANQRFNAMLGLSHLGNSEVAAQLVQQLVQLPPSHSLVTQSVRELRSDPAQWRAAREGLSEKLAELDSDNLDATIRTALLQFFLYRENGDAASLAELCKKDADPTDRTKVILSLRNFHPDLKTIQQCLIAADNSDIAYSVLCGLGDIGSQPAYATFSQQDWGSLLQNVVQHFVGDPAVISAARWLALQRSVPWEERWIPASTSYVQLGEGLNMIQLHPAVARHGVLNPAVTITTHAPHEARLTYDYFISDCEVPQELFLKFLDDVEDLDAVSEKRQIGIDNQQGQLNSISNRSHLPVTNVSWNAAAAFCNWLSRKHGRQPCYKWTAGKSIFREPIPDGFPEACFVCDQGQDGFRLPSEAEWEHATRAFTESELYFGNDHSLVYDWVHFTSRRITPALPPRTTMPNPFGLHETLGNVWEWTNDWNSQLNEASYEDYFGPEEKSLTDYAAKSYRGGGVNTVSGEPGSHSRGALSPNNYYANIGFRVVYRNQE